MYYTVTKTKINIRISYFLFVTSFLLLATLAGCGNKFFDPTQVGRFRTVPSVNVILDSLGVAEETPIAWEEGEEPKPADTLPDMTDYTFQSGDIIRVDIYELLDRRTRFINDYVVTETGKISIPEVGVIEVAGLTETQLEGRIKEILSPNLLKNPIVTVTLISSQQRAFSILGDGVLAPNRYIIPRYNFRLTDALAMASGTRQFNVSYIYVSRPVEDENKSQPMSNLDSSSLEPGKTERGAATFAQQKRNFNTSTIKNQFRWPQSNVVISSSEMVNNSEYVRTSKNFELFDAGKQNRARRETVLQMSDMPNINSNAIDRPVSVQEVLKTLSERSGRGSETNVSKSASNKINSYNPPAQNYRQVNTQLNQKRRFGASPGTVIVGSTGEFSDTENSGNIEWIFKNGKWVPVQTGPSQPEEAEAERETGHIEWVFRNGKWVPVQVGEPEPTEPVTQPEQPYIPPAEEVAMPDFGWAEYEVQTRLIKIPTDKLFAGDPRYNIVIKPGDTIFVPVDIVGEFYIMGNVNSTGTIPLTGRPMTLKQAIAAAGGFSPLAWPKRCEVIRRIGRKKEEIVMVDLDKIYNGEQPDFFIKPHDLVNVGTHATARWRAILRNAFRATYGFGFVYDRNFADRDFYTRRPIPNWF
jgi:protein involved in polysaccharide export with SLBB domain